MQWALVLSLLVVWGCNESLFGSHRAGGGGGDGGDTGDANQDVPETCPEPCIADAARDYSNTVNGQKNWRYLDDDRDRTWVPMKLGAIGWSGQLTATAVSSCADSAGSSACSALGHALLLSSSNGASGLADPAIELTMPSRQVIGLGLRVYVPPGAAPQLIRLYRNSREDALFTATVPAGSKLLHKLTLDALAGDRFLVAVVSTGAGAMDVGVELYASGSTAPSDCQLDLPFETKAAGGTTTPDTCRGGSFSQLPSPQLNLVSLAPFAEQHGSIQISPGNTVVGDHAIDQTTDLTVQLWVQLLALPTTTTREITILSDLDNDLGGGLELSVIADFDPGGGLPHGPGLAVAAYSHTSPLTVDRVITVYPSDGGWQFVRVARTSTGVDVCLNGVWQKHLLVDSTASFSTTNSPTLGRKATPATEVAYFDGRLDDVRAITTALPCARP